MQSMTPAGKTPCQPPPRKPTVLRRTLTVNPRHPRFSFTDLGLFFRWIKGHLRIAHYYGTSPNAVKTQIWIAMAVYLMAAILHKQLCTARHLAQNFATSECSSL